MTRKNAMLAMLVGLLCVGVATPSWAQGGWKRWGAPGRGYAPRAVETVAGAVVRVDKLPGGKGRSYGVGLTLQTEKETLPVLLGPAWYLDRLGFHPVPGDKLEITGSRTFYEGQVLFIAGEVKKGDKILKLRNETGVPVWAGRKWSF